MILAREKGVILKIEELKQNKTKHENITCLKMSKCDAPEYEK